MKTPKTKSPGAKSPQAKSARPKSPPKATKPAYFPRPADFREWLAANHETATELLVGLHKLGSGRPSITWPESVAEALCFGWIDGVRRSVDEHSYTIRFTPRKASGIWSTVNTKKMQELIASRLVYPAGTRAFEQRSDERSAIYAYKIGTQRCSTRCRSAYSGRTARRGSSSSHARHGTSARRFGASSAPSAQ